MSDFSIITCVSRPEVYERCLLQSTNRCRKRHSIEFIPIINNDNRYSASNALNYGIDVAKSDTIIIAHQDISLLDDWFDILKKLLIDAPDDYGVIGSAGISLQYGRNDIGKWGGALHTDTVAVGSVWDSDENLTSEPYWNGVKELTQAHCADECLLVLNRKTGLRFDARFTGFHFYGIDLCLQARAAGYGVYCAHLPIVHYGKYSTSFINDKRYWTYLRYLHNKWRLRFPELLSTHMHWSTNEAAIPLTGRQFEPELTSYISMSLGSSGGQSIQIRASGINRVQLTTDRQSNIIEDLY